jgi:hypothetical protein
MFGFFGFGLVVALFVLAEAIFPNEDNDYLYEKARSLPIV